MDSSNPASTNEHGSQKTGGHGDQKQGMKTEDFITEQIYQSVKPIMSKCYPGKLQNSTHAYFKIPRPENKDTDR